MKVRLYPKKETVIGHLRAKVAEHEGDLTACKERLRSLSESALFVQESEKRACLVNIQLFEADIASVNKQIELLESHDPPEVMVEMEIG